MDTAFSAPWPKPYTVFDSPSLMRRDLPNIIGLLPCSCFLKTPLQPFGVHDGRRQHLERVRNPICTVCVCYAELYGLANTWEVVELCTSGRVTDTGIRTGLLSRLLVQAVWSSPSAKMSSSRSQSWRKRGGELGVVPGGGAHRERAGLVWVIA
jgi:hypothetical protein